MIAPLRARHRWISTALAIALPVAYVAALTVRPDWSEVVDTVPAPAGAARLEGDLAASTWLDGEGLLVVAPDADPHLPDVLIYWTAGGAGGADLPDDARLLGALAGAATRTLLAPPAGPGTLVAYSLAHGRTVAHGPAPAPQGGE